MTLNKDRYTVYEIEKLTNGKLSKYKLTKAILNGELKAEKVNSNKRGRGVPNYFVHESDLEVYLAALQKSNTKFQTLTESETTVEASFDGGSDLTNLISQTSCNYR